MFTSRCEFLGKDLTQEVLNGLARTEVGLGPACRRVRVDGLRADASRLVGGAGELCDVRSHVDDAGAEPRS